MHHVGVVRNRLKRHCAPHTLDWVPCAGVQQDCLHRVLRAAVNHRCLAAAPGGWGRAPRFRNTALTRMLLRDDPNSVKAFVRALPSPPRLHYYILSLQALQGARGSLVWTCMHTCKCEGLGPPRMCSHMHQHTSSAGEAAGHDPCRSTS